MSSKVSDIPKPDFSKIDCSTLKQGLVPVKKSDEYRVFISDNELLDYGVEVKSGVFQAGETTCAVPYDVTACYSLAVAQVMGASLVSLIGFDGYENQDPRHLEMIEVFTLVKELTVIPAIRSLTPTSYPLEQGSIYAPF